MNNISKVIFYTFGKHIEHMPEYLVESSELKFLRCTSSMTHVEHNNYMSDYDDNDCLNKTMGLTFICGAS
jgi:hypothetical protein